MGSVGSLVAWKPFLLLWWEPGCMKTFSTPQCKIPCFEKNVLAGVSIHLKQDSHSFFSTVGEKSAKFSGEWTTRCLHWFSASSLSRIMLFWGIFSCKCCCLVTYVFSKQQSHKTSLVFHIEGIMVQSLFLCKIKDACRLSLDFMKEWFLYLVEGAL